VSAAAPALPKLGEPGRLAFTHVLLSEWTKFKSVRSTKWSLGIAIFLMVALPLIPAFVTSHQWTGMSPSERAGDNPLDFALVGVYIAQLAIAVLGVLMITAEYSTGSIRSTFTAVPKRLPVLWAKLLDFALVTLALMVPAVIVSFFETQAILGDIPALQISLTTPNVARCIFLAPVYVMLVGIFALALGAIVRSTAGAISLFAGIFFILPLVTLAMPSSTRDAVLPFLPDEAGRQLFMRDHGAHTLTPLAGGVTFAVYCAVAIAIAAFLLRRRDV
jgi:ABC-2 type transport system permease protein